MQYFNFSMVGSLSFLIMFFITLIFTEYYFLSYQFSYAIGLSFAYLYNFYFNMKLTFVAPDHTVLRLERFAIVGFLISFLSWAGAIFLVEIFESNYLFAILMTQLSMALLRFRLDKVWIFAKIPKSKHHRFI